jgi:tRNA threonylcarbamoyladenosine biosynthesis protein TsaB
VVEDLGRAPSLKLLSIETATPCVGCALWSDSGPVASFMFVGRQRHAEILMPAVDELCRRAGWSVADLTAVAVDVGPGLFTGLRVGLATARTIAAARGIPAAGVNSLEALAHACRRRAGLVVPMVDARRGEIYWAMYRCDGATAEELRPPAVLSPDALATELASAGEPVLAVGDGAWRYREQLVAGGTEVGDEGEMWPSALAVAELAAFRFVGGGTGGRDLPAPLYLRPADVRIGWEEVGGRVGGGPNFRSGPAGPGPGPAAAPASSGSAAVSRPQEPKLGP